MIPIWLYTLSLKWYSNKAFPEWMSALLLQIPKEPNKTINKRCHLLEKLNLITMHQAYPLVVFHFLITNCSVKVCQFTIWIDGDGLTKIFNSKVVCLYVIFKRTPERQIRLIWNKIVNFIWSNQTGFMWFFHYLKHSIHNRRVTGRVFSVVI